MEEPKQTVSGSLPYKEMPCFWQVFTRSGGASFFCFCKLEEFYGHRGAVPVDGGCRYSLWSSALTKKILYHFSVPPYLCILKLEPCQVCPGQEQRGLLPRQIPVNTKNFTLLLYAEHGELVCSFWAWLGLFSTRESLVLRKLQLPSCIQEDGTAFFFCSCASFAHYP